MGLSIKHAETSTFLSGVGRQPLRERHVCSNVKDDIPQQRCKEGRPQQRHPHARTVSRGKIHSARYVARPAGQDPAEENRPAVKDKEGQGQSKLLRMHRKGNVESSSCRPTATVTSSTAAVSQATFEDSIGAPQGLGDGRRRTSAGTMHAVTSGDVRDNLDGWRNHYNQSAVGSLSYVKSPLDVVAATDPTNTSSVLNTDPARRNPSTCLATNGPGLSPQSRPRRHCWICGWERSRGSQERAARGEEDGVLGVLNLPVRVPPTARTGLFLRPATAAAEGCWFCHEGEATGERSAGLGADCRDVMSAPIATVGGHVRSSAGRVPFDGRDDGRKVGDSQNGSAEHRLEVSAGMQTESGVAELVEVHVGMQARSGVDDNGEERDRRAAQATGCAVEGLDGRLAKARDRGTGEQLRSAGKRRGNRRGLVGPGLSESLVDDGLATLRSGSNRRFQERGGCQQKGTIIRDATPKKYGIIEGTRNGDCANLRGREGGGGYEGRKRNNSGKVDSEIGRKSVPWNSPRGEFSPIRKAACFGDGGDEGRNPAYAQAGAFGYPLCWEEDGVWWFRPGANDATRDSHTAAVDVLLEYRSKR
ncbi:unnamed protein product [Laminaria digitata]